MRCGYCRRLPAAGLAFGLAVAFAICLTTTAFAADKSPGKSRWGKGYIPNVELTTQDGAKVRFYDDVIKDRIVVISFIYTSCRDICPLITARMAQVYEKLGAAAGRDFHFVSISIDPENDTPQRMKEHAEAFRADPRWVFLTGSRADIDLVRYRLGERSRKLAEHRSDILLRNDSTGEWARDSAFADLDRLTFTIRTLDPEWRHKTTAVTAARGTKAATTPGPGVGTGASLATEELPGQALFIKGCASCHTIGRGDRVGPDLYGVTARRSLEWLSAFIRNPERVRARKEPEMAALMARFPAVRMPSLQLSDHDASDLIGYLRARSFAFAADQRDAASGRQPHGAHNSHHHGQHKHH